MSGREQCEHLQFRNIPCLTAVAHCVSGEEFPELLLRGVSKSAGSQGTSPRGI